MLLALQVTESVEAAPRQHEIVEETVLSEREVAAPAQTEGQLVTVLLPSQDPRVLRFGSPIGVRSASR